MPLPELQKQSCPGSGHPPAKPMSREASAACVHNVIKRFLEGVPSGGQHTAALRRGRARAESLVSPSRSWEREASD